jgi:hypothetical protein
MKKILNVIDALYHMLSFKTYTTMPRGLEIGYGVLGWLCIIVICSTFVK